MFSVGTSAPSIMPRHWHSTAAVQPALLIAGVATARALMAEQVSPAFVGGMSVGAFGAAVICGAFSFTDALPLVQHARGNHAGGLPERLRTGRHRRARRNLRAKHCGAYSDGSVARLRFQHQCVPADRRRREWCGARRGDRPGSPTRRTACRTFGGRRPVALPAASAGRRAPGATHGPAPAAASVAALREQPRRAAPFYDAEAIRRDLATSIAHPVRWYDALEVLSELGAALSREWFRAVSPRISSRNCCPARGQSRSRIGGSATQPSSRHAKMLRNQSGQQTEGRSPRHPTRGT